MSDEQCKYLGLNEFNQSLVLVWWLGCRVAVVHGNWLHNKNNFGEDKCRLDLRKSVGFMMIALVLRRTLWEKKYLTMGQNCTQVVMENQSISHIALCNHSCMQAHSREHNRKRFLCYIWKHDIKEEFMLNKSQTFFCWRTWYTSQNRDLVCGWCSAFCVKGDIQRHWAHDNGTSWNI